MSSPALAIAPRLAVDGVAVVRGACDPARLAFFQALAGRVDRHERNLMARNGESLDDAFLWITEKDCEEFLMHSRLPEIAAHAMGVDSVRLYYDQLFMKVAGHSAATRWHQDIAHWPLEGAKTCSIWLAIDEVNREGGALRYLAGSHLWNRTFRPWEGAPGEPLPDFEAAEFRACERSFDLAPGDCAVHDGRTVHASYPNRVPGTRRLAYVTRWFGGDVRFRNKGFAPAYPVDVPVVDGAYPDHPLFLPFSARARRWRHTGRA